MLKVDRINVSYGDVQVLYDVSLSVEKGEIVTILGSNGAGKTTLIKAICSMLPLKSGSISYFDTRLDKLPSHRLIELGISLVPEGRHLFPNMTVNDNLLMGAYCMKDKNAIKENIDWVLELFPRLRERKNQLAGTLSGGEQQMCAIARGLITKPQMIIFDEPSLGLAPIIVDQIFETLDLIAKKDNSTILLIEQNAQLALEACDRGYVLENGRLILSGTSRELLNSTEVQKAYLGL